VVTRHAWLSGREFIDGLTLGQVTPGPVIVTATFIGFKLGGLVGGAFATLCVLLPSAVLLFVLAPQIAGLRQSQAVSRVISGLLAGFLGMLLFVLWQLAVAGMTDPLTLAIAMGSIVALRFVPNPIWTVLGPWGSRFYSGDDLLRSGSREVGRNVEVLAGGVGVRVAAPTADAAGGHGGAGE